MVLFELAGLIMEGIRDGTEKAYLEYLEDELRKLRWAYEQGQIARKDFEKRQPLLTRLITIYREATEKGPSPIADISFQ